MAREHPLMPHATAEWLVDNSTLSFDQIADFCGLHILEVQSIADETAQHKHIPRDPIEAGELTRDELKAGEADPKHKLVMSHGPEQQLRTRGPRYTPVSKRVDKPDGIAWLVQNHPDIPDSKIGKLIGTTKNTIQAIRSKTHWNMDNITPKDPVALGLCSQRDLDVLVEAAAQKAGVEISDPKFESDRAALLAELKAEREAAKLAAQEAADAEAMGLEPGANAAEAGKKPDFVDPWAKK
ncbi:cell cycle transcriptional regulator TrcR [Pacificimonas sp. ICDLI1SI03]